MPDPVLDNLRQEQEEAANKALPRLDFGDSDAGLIIVVLFSKEYKVSPCREMSGMTAKVKELIAAKGDSPDDVLQFTNERMSEAGRWWVKQLTGKDCSYEMGLSVYFRMDQQAMGRLDFFGLGPNSQTGSESARGQSQSTSETTSSTPSSAGPENTTHEPD